MMGKVKVVDRLNTAVSPGEKGEIINSSIFCKNFQKARLKNPSQRLGKEILLAVRYGFLKQCTRVFAKGAKDGG
jgi:hypothetical protein